MDELTHAGGEALEAKVIEDDLMISEASFEIDMSGIQRDIEELTLAIDNALTVYGNLAIEADAIAAMTLPEAQRCERTMSSAIREADELRRKLNRDYRVPLDIAKQRYDELMGPVIELHAAYKQRRLQLAEEEKAQKVDAIRTLYEGMAERIALPAVGQAAPLAPFERVFERFGAKWLNKGRNLNSIESELADVVERLLAGERRLDEARLAHDTEARAVYWETFDVDAAFARDRELCALERTEIARKAELAAPKLPLGEIGENSPVTDARAGETLVTGEFGTGEATGLEAAAELGGAGGFLTSTELAMATGMGGPGGTAELGMAGQSVDMAGAGGPVAPADSAGADGSEAADESNPPVSPDPSQALRKPRVMLIDGATDDECRQIGQLCKSLGISGTFKGERFYEAVMALEGRTRA